MTKDEMKQEAKEFIDNRYKHEILGKRVQEFFTFWELLCSIVDFAEPREKRIAELEKENNKLESRNDNLVKMYNEVVERQNSFQQSLYKNIEELEKENAELNKKLSEAEADYDKMFWNKNEIISKAKEIIENIIRVTWGEGWNYSLDWKVKAEQFLKEVSE